MRLTAADRPGHIGNPEIMIDVVPLGGGVWLARCECNATERFNSSEAGWSWVLSHPCPNPDVIDLTQPTDTRRD